jgi:hypothetical protein
MPILEAIIITAVASIVTAVPITDQMIAEARGPTYQSFYRRFINLFERKILSEQQQATIAVVVDVVLNDDELLMTSGGGAYTHPVSSSQALVKRNGVESDATGNWGELPASRDEEILYNGPDATRALSKVPALSRHRQLGLSAILVARAKAKFHLDTYSKANYLVCRKFLYDEMVLAGMRPTHIAKMLNLCVEMCFIPSRAERLARDIGNSRYAREMRELHSGRYYTNWWTSFFSFLPQRLSEWQPSEG